MTTLLTILHVFICLGLIAIVLLQGGKGAEMGASFGAGGSNTVFGAAGGQSFMGKLTTAVAVLFMLTSLVLTYFAGQAGTSSVMPASVVATTPQPAAFPAATASPEAQPTPEATATTTVPDAVPTATATVEAQPAPETAPPVAPEAMPETEKK